MRSYCTWVSTPSAPTLLPATLSNAPKDKLAYAYGAQVAEAVFALEQGTTPPIATEFGYHILWIDEATPATPMSFGEARDAVITEVVQAQRQAAQDAFYTEARDDVDVQLQVELPGLGSTRL